MAARRPVAQRRRSAMDINIVGAYDGSDSSRVDLRERFALMRYMA